ncbi:MAG: tetratricopeptide repeat protein [Treponemataceae bacterium]
MKKTLLLIILVAALSSCGGSNAKNIKRIQALEEGVQNPTTIDELKTAIAKYQNRVVDVIAAHMQIGLWYKMLGSRYVDNQMYGEALKAYQEALKIYPSNQNLFYYVGVCAGYMAKAALDYNAVGATGEKENYLLLSESAYKRALELEPRMVRSLYGLAVLYTFELNQPAQAIMHLETLLDIDTKNFDAMMVLARAYYMTYDFDRAVVLYDKIIQQSSSQQRKAEAEENKKVVLNAAFLQ